jgi:hypothetical protein
MKSVLEEIARDRRHIALPPAPGVGERLVDLDQADGEGADHDQNQRPFPSPHGSRLDKAPG